jgi:MerR family mercuric resistance operon transcriptional regulator
MNHLKIGQLAKQANVNIQTIRYYERIGLMTSPQKLESGYRLYSDNDITRVKFIKRSQNLGFSLKEIKTLLTLRVEPEVSCDQVRKQAETKIQEIEIKIHELKQIKQALTKLVTACLDNHPTSECPILEALEDA